MNISKIYSNGVNFTSNEQNKPDSLNKIDNKTIAAVGGIAAGGLTVCVLAGCLKKGKAEVLDPKVEQEVNNIIDDNKIQKIKEKLNQSIKGIKNSPGVEKIKEQAKEKINSVRQKSNESVVKIKEGIRSFFINFKNKIK